jgi:YrbI family 3-deoxy-D-manno-octulosonate 8-phosphate phosphatase
VAVGIFAKRPPQLIVYDFDGVMTDNRVLVSETGDESVCVNRSDGLAVSRIRDELGIRQIILSTEVNPVVQRRAEKLKIEAIYAVGDKAKTLMEYIHEKELAKADVLMVGNDVNDLDAMRLCGCSCCPKDAEPEILRVVDLVIQRRGGEGVIRELYRLLTANRDGYAD